MSINSRTDTPERADADWSNRFEEGENTLASRHRPNWFNEARQVIELSPLEQAKIDRIEATLNKTLRGLFAGH